jgi:hypothetical protein
MTRCLVVLAALLFFPIPAWAFWPTTTITARDMAEQQLPLEITLADAGNDTVEVLYKVTPTGAFRTLSALRAFAHDGDKVLFLFPLGGEPSVVRGLPNQPAELSKPLTGRFTVAKALLPKCRLSIDCPIEPLNLSGQTYLVNLASFRKP